MGFKVYDTNGEDVTDKHEWFVNSNGVLFYLTNDVDSPLVEAEDDYWYSPE